MSGEGAGAPATGAAPGRARAALPALAVVAAGALAHANAFDVPFVFDDWPNIVEAPAVRVERLGLAEALRAAEGFPLHRWLARLSFAASHAAFGLAPAGWHAVNLAFHLAASLLVLAVGRRLLAALAWGDEAGRARAGLAAGLLFAVHPAHTQAVTYVVQRMTSMGAAFALLAAWLWLGARGRTGRGRAARLAGAGLAGFLALGCKESYAALPAVLLAVEWVLDPALGARIRRRWRAWLAGAAVAAALGAAALAPYGPILAAEHARSGIPVADRLLSQGRVLVHYLSLVALPLPSRLHVDHAAFVPSRGLLEPWTTLPAVAAVLALAAGAVLGRRRAPVAAVAVLWFLAALSVEQTVLPLDLVFEQRIYFASAGLFVLAGAAAVRLVRVPRLGAWAAVVPAVALLAAGTRARNEDWRDPAVLFDDPAANAPHVPRGLLAVGATLRDRGDLAGAERAFRRAAELAPRHPDAWVHLGSLALGRGELADAERLYARALAIDPRSPEVWYDLGIVHGRAGRAEAAVAAHERALALDPGLTDARVSLAVLRYRGGDAARALALLDEALARDPGSVLALEKRAALRAERGEPAGALADARRAVALAPERAGPWVALALAHRAAGREGESREALAEALRRDPEDRAARALADAGSPGP